MVKSMNELSDEARSDIVLVVVTDFSTVAIKPTTLARFAANKHRRPGKLGFGKRVRSSLERVVMHASRQQWLRGRVLTKL